MGWRLAGGVEGTAGHALGLSFNLNMEQQTDPEALQQTFLSVSVCVSFCHSYCIP